MNQASVISAPHQIAEKFLNTILVAYDSSQESKTGLDYAVSLAQSFLSSLNVVHVETPAEYRAELEAGFGQMQDSQKLLQLDLDAVAVQLDDVGIHNRVLHRMGAVTDVLVQLAAECRADLLVLGAYGHRSIDRLRLGSTAEFALRSMPCAVLTVGPGTTLSHYGKSQVRTVLYASSLPENPGKTSEFIRTFAERFSAHVDILHAIEIPSKGHDPRTSAEMRRTADRLATHLREPGVSVSWNLAGGDQSQLIVERARAIRADLIFFGIEHSPTDPGMAGVISATIRRAPCPVLTVPGPA